MALLAAAFVVGLCLGSFANVVVWRVPRGESVVQPPSHCPACDRPLAWWENVPVVAWIALRGRCRTCGATISLRYPLVELAAGVLVALAAWRRPDAALPALAVGFVALLAISLIDLETRLVPNRVLGPTVVACVMLLVAGAAAAGRWDDLARALAGAVVAFAALAVIHLLAPAGMGFGDVKLAFLCGLLLGWSGLALVPFGLFAGFLIGAVVGVAAMVATRGGRKTTVPFAPFLAAGTVAAALWGAPLVDWYTRSFAAAW